MHAALAPYVDGAIAKTLTVPKVFPKSGIAEHGSTSGRAND